MKSKLLLVFLLGLISYEDLSAQANIVSNGSGAWNVGTTWVGGVAPATGDNVTIAAGHTVTLTIDYNNTGGTVTVNSGGILLNGGGGSFNSGNGTIIISGGGTYQHGQNGGVIPTCTWSGTSTCLVTGVTTAVPTAGLGQSFGHFTWNCNASTLSLEGALTTVTGNLTINNTATAGTVTLRLSTTQSPTINITGDFNMSAPGNDIIQFTNSGSPVINVGGSFNVTAGRFIFGTTGFPVLNVTGNFLYSTTLGTASSMSGGTGTGTMNITGNFSYTRATPTLISETSTGTGTINFVGNKSHTFSTAVVNPFNNKIQLDITASDTLDISASTTNFTLHSSGGVNVNLLTINGTLITGTKIVTVNATATCNLAAGGTLHTSNVSGVNATITGGGTRTFNAAANYILANASTTTGFTGASTTMNNLTTTASAILGESITVNGVFLHSTGTFTAGANIVAAGTFTNSATYDAGSSTLNVTTAFTNNGTFNAGTSSVNITGSFTNTASGVYTASATTLYVGGDFANNGTFNANTGTVVFNGAVSSQDIGGTTTTNFNNMELDNSLGSDLTQHVNLVGILNITSGTFRTTGFNLTLLSNASGTASIGEILGDFTGNMTLQRYVAASPNDWRFFCSPASGRTVGQWVDDFATSGFSGSTCGPADCGTCGPTCNYPSIYWYDESNPDMLDSGYVAITDSSNALVAGRGYWVYLGPNPLTFEVAGPPNKFAVPLDVSFNPGFSQEDDGWCLVSNPYPSAIDWDDADWLKTNMNDAVYIYNASTGTYAWHVPGTTPDSVPNDGNGGSQYIASQQAFWVKVTDEFTPPVLTANEGVKAAAQNPSFLKNSYSPNTSHYPSAFKDFPVPLNTNNVPGRLRLTARGNGYDDEIMIRFVQGATNNFDGKYDAWKLIHPNYNVHNFSSVIAGNKDLVLNSLPPLTTDINIPLRLTVPSTGTYSISRDSTLMLPLSSCLILEDTKTGSMINLRTTVTYTFTIADTTAAPRFILHTYAPITKKGIHVSCPGGSNGKAIATGTGSGPWNYVWKDALGNTLKTTTGSTTSDTLYNCVPGVYTINVNGAVCGALTDTILIKEPDVIAAAFTQTNVSCFGGNNGAVTALASGGTSPYSYLWNTGSTTNTASSLLPGNYSVTITDAKSCTSTLTVAITQPLSALVAASSQTNATCFGDNDGTASVLASGGTVPYSYLWNNAQTTSAAVNLIAGNYSAVITDANGCTTTATMVITQPALLSASVSVTNVLCFGESNGTAAVSGSGGALPYSYLWDDGQTTSAAINLSIGNYFVTLTDANGCASTALAAIAQPAVLTVSTSANPAPCLSSNGDASASAGGGTAAYFYLWNNGQTTATATGLSAGSYSLTVTDANGCSVAGYANVSNTGGVTASIASSSPVSCFGGNTGSATAGISGGNPPFTYSWNTTPLQNTISATGLSAGNYNVTVTDGSGCISIASVTISGPAVLSVVPAQTNISCFGMSDGAASVSPSGGTLPYTFLWSNSESSSSVTGLATGNYSVTVTDANGCYTVQNFSISQPSSALATVISSVNVSCFGEADGSASATPSGGTAPFSYLWDDGQLTSVASSLVAGTYSVTVTDANGCTTSSSVSITEPPVLINSVSLTNVSCFGGGNGSATVSASGGTPAYSYLWNNGQTASTAVNLSAGNYSVTVTDANGCTTAASVSISQSAAIVAGFTSSTDTVDIAISGTVSFTNSSSGATNYQWDFGDTSGIFASANPSHTYQNAGTYTVMLIAISGTCSDTAYTTIVVINSTSIYEQQYSSAISVVYDNYGEVYLSFSFDKKTQVSIRVYNMIGEELLVYKDLAVKHDKIKLDLGDPSSGIYVAVSEFSKVVISKKILLLNK